MTMLRVRAGPSTGLDSNFRWASPLSTHWFCKYQATPYVRNLRCAVGQTANLNPVDLTDMELLTDRIGGTRLKQTIALDFQSMGVAANWRFQTHAIYAGFIFLPAHADAGGLWLLSKRLQLSGLLLLLWEVLGTP
jgi:hypothetical protein